MTPREVEKKIKSEGWYLVDQVGSHRHYKHPTKPGKITIAFHPRPKDIPLDILKKIFKQAGIK